MPTAIIVDDEAPMRAQLSLRLKNVWPQLLILAEASSGVEAITLVEQHKPDIIFLDIRMPGLSGIETAKVLFNQCHIVFVTAYDQYAVEAFDQGAIDYLLKPVDSERLKRTCERLHLRLDKQPENIEQLLKNLLKLDKANTPNYLRWIQASLGSSLRMISTQEILFFRADDKYTRVQTEKSEFLIRKPLKDLALELDPQEFWRIHRSTLVRVEAITEVTRDYRGRHIVHIRNHPEHLEVSRNHSHLFQQM